MADPFNSDHIKRVPLQCLSGYGNCCPASARLRLGRHFSVCLSRCPPGFWTVLTTLITTLLEMWFKLDLTCKLIVFVVDCSEIGIAGSDERWQRCGRQRFAVRQRRSGRRRWLPIGLCRFLLQQVIHSFIKWLLINAIFNLKKNHYKGMNVMN